MRVITPVAAILIMVTFSLVLGMISLTITNLASLDTKNVVTQLNETNTNIEQSSNAIETILSNGTRSQAIVDEIRNAQNLSEMQRQNQSRFLIPIMLQAFKQTNEMLNQTELMLNSTENMEEFVNFIGSQFDNEYLVRENFQYHQANKTFDYLERSLQNQETIIKLLNNQST